MVVRVIGLIICDTNFANIKYQLTAKLHTFNFFLSSADSAAVSSTIIMNEFDHRILVLLIKQQ